MDINKYSVEETTNFLSSFLPEGKSFESKNCEDSNLRKYLNGKSQEFKRINDLFFEFLSDIDPRVTINYIEEWESALGIPDSCINIASTDQERRDNIVLKLASLSIQTESDFQNLGTLFGFTISTENNKYPPYDVPFIPFSEYGAKFIWEISGDFTSNPTKATIFQCLVKLLIPSNYDVLFINV